MAQITDLEESAAPKSAVATSCTTEDCTKSAGPSNQHSDTGANGFKTLDILNEWPIIISGVSKTKQYYESLKTSSGVLNWSFGLAERIVSVLRDRSSSVLPVVYPAARIADRAVSGLAEQLQRKLPVVRQPPPQVYDAVRSGFRNLLAPLFDKIEFSPGMKWVRNAAESLVEINQKLISELAKWLDPQAEGITAPQMQQQQQQQQSSLTEPMEVDAASVPKRALKTASSSARSSIGSFVCLLSRLPVFGSLLSHTPSPASFKSTSPQR